MGNAVLIQNHVRKRFEQLTEKMRTNPDMKVIIASLWDRTTEGMPNRDIAETHVKHGLGRDAKNQWGTDQSGWQGTVDVLTIEIEDLLDMFGPDRGDRVLFGTVGSKEPTNWDPLYKEKPSKNLFHVWGANDMNWLPRDEEKDPDTLGGGQASAFNHNDLVWTANPGLFAGKSENPLPVFGIVTTPIKGTKNLNMDAEGSCTMQSQSIATSNQRPSASSPQRPPTGKAAWRQKTTGEQQGEAQHVPGPKPKEGFKKLEQHLEPKSPSSHSTAPTDSDQSRVARGPLPPRADVL